jgi:hypothetical protein
MNYSIRLMPQLWTSITRSKAEKGEAQITQAHKDNMMILQADIFPYEGIWILLFGIHKELYNKHGKHI